jgi:hypothetical protein
MTISNISNGEGGASVRSTLNEVIDQLNKLGLDIEFSADNLVWHYPWAGGDLYMKLSADYGSTWSDGIFLNYSDSGSAGWDEAQWDDSNGNLTFLIDSVVEFVVNLDGRYATLAEASKTNYTITLPSASNVADRVAGATEVPDGWALTADGLNLDIQHDLGRYGMAVTVFATTTDPANQQLFDTAAYSGILNEDTNNMKITSLATIQKEIRIFISFAQ